MLTRRIHHAIKLTQLTALLTCVCLFGTASRERPPLIRALPIEDPTGEALFNFHAALAQGVEIGTTTRIVHYGDSHIASDWFANALRKQWGAGVIYDAFGINGARATRALTWDWEALAEQFAAAPPDLIVVAYGSNEAGDTDLNLTTYQRAFSELLRRFHEAAPLASLLVLAPPDRAAKRKGSWQSLASLPPLIEMQRRAAFENGAAFWNLYEAMGGAGGINRWREQQPALAQADHVHLTAAGYRLVAQTLYQVLRTTELVR